MEDLENAGVQLELKYCERCGGLWLRPVGSDLIFCSACAKAMAGIAPVWPRGAAIAITRARKEARGGVGAFWGEGGNA
jgi:hypothetical protein